MLSLTIPWIWSHPLASRHRLDAYRNYLWWQLQRRLMDQPYQLDWVNGSTLIFSPRMHGATGNFYAGLHEWPDMPFVLHLLRAGDHMLDIGSNVGSYTVLAAAAIGASCTACEPVHLALSGLRANIAANSIEHLVSIVEACIGAEHGEVRFTTDAGPMNCLVSVADATLADSCSTQVVLSLPVDAIPAASGACCWKVDVEGLEAQVLRGARNTLRSQVLQAILLENRSDDVASTMGEHGFTPCNYDPWNRRLLPGQPSSGANQIWVRDLDWVGDRLQSAPAFHVFSEEI